LGLDEIAGNIVNEPQLITPPRAEVRSESVVCPLAGAAADTVTESTIIGKKFK
jgi:hypothetical protein